MEQQHPYEIEIRIEPSTVIPTKPWKKRVRNLTRSLVEKDWNIHTLLCGENPNYDEIRKILQQKSAEIDSVFRQRFEDAKDTPLGLHEIRFDLPEDKNKIVIHWTTRQAYERKHQEQKDSMRVLQKILRMKRDRHRPPEWDRYLTLRSNWPSKMETMFPLPDPDKVQKEKSFYKNWVDQLRPSLQQQTSPQSLIRVLVEYLDMCLQT